MLRQLSSSSLAENYDALVILCNLNLGNIVTETTGTSNGTNGLFPLKRL
jgi:hypothetical protein